MDEIEKNIIKEKIESVLGIQVYLENSEKGFFLYLDRAHLYFDNDGDIWSAHYHRTDYYKEGEEWTSVTRDIPIDEYELASNDRKNKLHKIIDYLNSLDFIEAKEEFLDRIDCETLVVRNKRLSFNEVKTTVIGTNYNSESTFLSHRSKVIEGLFPDYKNVCVYKHEQEEEIEYLYHELVSCNSALEYYYIDDLKTLNIFSPCYKGFQEACIDRIIEDYHDLVNANYPTYVRGDDKVRKLLEKIKHKCPLPAISNEEAQTPYVCFYMIEGVSNIPLLLFIAMFKNVFGFHSINDTIYSLNYQSFFWKSDGKIMFCAYTFAGEEQIKRFTGYRARQFNPYAYDYWMKDYDSRECSLPSHLDIFKK